MKPEIPVPQKNRSLLSQKGQTLFEIVVVMGILIVLAAMVLPQLRSSRNLSRFAGLQREIVAQLRNARQQAISQRQAVTLRYDDTNKVLVLSGGIYGALGASANKQIKLWGYGLKPYEIVYGRPSGAVAAPLGDATDMTPLAGGYADITFQPDGSVLDGGGNPLARAWFLYHANMPGTTGFAVSVLGFGGRVKSWKYSAANGVYEE